MNACVRKRKTKEKGRDKKKNIVKERNKDLIVVRAQKAVITKYFKREGK